jgi:D-arabinose 1-dehydrogenase-like Zn-dependent alcohol dehydrogenase
MASRLPTERPGCASASLRSTRFETAIYARAGDVVAVLGLGGWVTLVFSLPAKMGFRTVAIARGNDEEALASKLGRALLHQQSNANRRRTP